MPTEPQKEISPLFAGAANDDGKKFYVDVVKYSEADAETKARMDKLIATIDMKDLNSITTFAKEPAEALGASSEAIVRRAQSATTFLGAFSSIKEKLQNFDFDSVTKMAQKYGEQLARRMEMAALKGFHPIKKLIYKLSGSRHNTTMDDLSHEIDKSLLQLGDVVADLEKARDKIPQVETDLQTLEAARLQAYSDFGLYIGAAAEKWRRVNEEELPKLRQEATTSPMKQKELENAELGSTVLNTKLTNMDGFHKTSLVQLKTISDLKQSLAMTQLNIDSHLTMSKEQWMALLAEASTAAQIGNLAETVKAADDFGDKIFEQSTKLSDLTKAMARDSFGHGTLDPVKVVEHLKKRTQDIQDDLKFIDDFNKKMVDERAALDQAGKDFREAALKISQPVAVKDDTAVATPAAAAPKKPTL